MTDSIDTHRALILAYLSGNASPSEVETFNQLMANDETFLALFEQIERESAPDLADIQPMAPPEGLLEDIMAEIAQDDAAQSAQIIDLSSKPAPPKQNSDPWRAIAAISTLAAAASISLHFMPGTPTTAPTASPPGIALLAGESAPSLLVVVYDIEERKILARMTNASLPDEAVWQLWLIRDGVEVPVSLGLLDETTPNGAISLQVEDELLIGEDILAISLEPLGGSRQAGPSGPVLFSGKIEAL